MELETEKATARKEPIAPIAVRIGIAIFLALCILLVVLLTCLSLVVSQPPAMPTTTTEPPETTTLYPVNFTGNVILDYGGQYVLNQSANVTTIIIQNGASLTFADTGQAITLRTKYILIQNGGSMRIGSEKNPYLSPLEIVLYGRSIDVDNYIPAFGRKFIGVTPTGTLEIHGPWKLSWTFLNQTMNVGDQLLTLVDDASTWSPNDKIVVASTSYDMNQAEVFTVASVSGRQIRVQEKAKYVHYAVTVNGVDMRAEVGLLTRNIKIHGEMDTTCYDVNMCQFFGYDTFGGTTHVLQGATAHIEGAELYNMGQQVLGRYPIHFHRAFYVAGMYVKQLSIHDCFSRCVTVHATIGLRVEDVVGYNTLGHCFFLEDGNEQNNTFIHNLGLVTNYGSLLPADRNAAMCVNLTTNQSYYMPDPSVNCMGVATFWISHPNNTFINNSAAGSAQVGFFYAFYRDASGPSAGTLPSFDGERSTILGFDGNRAHSNPKAGLLLDHGVNTAALQSADFPQDFLALINLELYTPHQQKNLTLPRAPANITRFTAFKNTQAVFVRGGDVWISDARLSDNDVGVTMASSATLPYDAGSHQQLVHSTLLGNGLNDAEWENRSSPCVGVQVRDGPVLIDSNSFSFFSGPVGSRQAYAIGFYPNNPGQSSPANTVQQNKFDSVSQKIQVGQVGSGQDGDLTQILHDVNGSLTGIIDSYVVRADNLLLASSVSCQPLIVTNAVVCPGDRYGQLYVNATQTNISLTVTDVVNNGTLTLNGVNNASDRKSTQFQPVLIANHTYRLSLQGLSTPTHIDLSVYNFDRYAYVMLEMPLPAAAATVSVTTRVWQQMTNSITSSSVLNSANSWDTYSNSTSSPAYYWNATDSVVYVRLTSQGPNPVDPYNYCASDGCHFVTIAMQ